MLGKVGFADVEWFFLIVVQKIGDTQYQNTKGRKNVQILSTVVKMFMRVLPDFQCVPANILILLSP